MPNCYMGIYSNQARESLGFHARRPRPLRTLFFGKKRDIESEGAGGSERRARDGRCEAGRQVKCAPC